MREFSLVPKRSPVKMIITGLTSDELISHELVEVKLRFKGMQVYRVEAVVLPIEEDWTAHIPETHPPWLSDVAPFLADPEIIMKAGQQLSYQMILGGDYMALFKISAFHFDQTFAMCDSMAGWIPRGKITTSCTTVPAPARIRIHRLNRKIKDMINDKLADAESDLDDEITQLILSYLIIDRIEFFGRPEDEIVKTKEKELQEAMQLISRNKSGRLVAILPKVKDYLRLISPNLYTGGIRIKSVIKLLERNDFISKAYADMFHKFVEMGVLRKINLEDLIKSGKKITELPHHGVIKLDSKSTPVRMVIAGDAKDRGGHSTIEIFLTGVNILPLILGILTHIRMEPQFILGDISKAFVQIELSEEDKNMLIIRWPLKKGDGSYDHEFYTFDHMPWGIKCAPSTLNCGLRYAFREEAANNSAVAELMRKNEKYTYVDDNVTTGKYDAETVANMKINKEVLKKYHFDVGKHYFYPPHLAQHFGEQPCLDPFKVLGCGFDPATDSLFIRMKNIEQYVGRDRISKRQAASILARPFDPLGFATPALMKAKELRQQIDIKYPKATWDRLLTKEDTKEWHALAHDLTHLEKIRVRRYVKIDNEVRREYHVFCDASGLGVGAVIYCVSYSETGVLVSLIAAKAKIAPREKIKKGKKTKSAEGEQPENETYLKAKAGFKVNRAELNAALLALKLYSEVKNELESAENVHYWSDSTCTLTWIKNMKYTGVEYVDSRLERIWKMSSSDMWDHCPGKDNPADCASRGMTAAELVKNKLWFDGPGWLSGSTQTKPSRFSINVAQKENKPPCIGKYDNCTMFPFASKCSKCGIKTTNSQACRAFENFIVAGENDLSKVIKRYAFFTQLARALKRKYEQKTQATAKKRNRVIAPPSKILDLSFCYRAITPGQLKHAELDVIRMVQKLYEPDLWDFFHKNPSMLKDGLVWDPHLRLIMSRSRQRLPTGELLSPLDKDLIFVPDKNQNLDKKCVNPVLELMYNRAHVDSGHGAVLATYTEFRHRFWSKKARKLATWAKRTCVTCIPIDSRPFEAPEPPLDNYRYIGDQVFRTMGIDFVGPFRIRYTDGRICEKVSICVFSCPLTRAIILRPVEGVGAKEFRHVLNTVCFDYDIHPDVILSDNAETFKCVWRNTLKAHELLLNKHPYIGQGPVVDWRFIPSHAPWWGGFYERMMAIIKEKMARCFHGANEFSSFPAFTEAVAYLQYVINSRPISWGTEGINEQKPIIPAYFFQWRPREFDDPYNYGPRDVSFECATGKELEKAVEKRCEWQNRLWALFHDVYTSELRKRHESHEIGTDCLLEEGQVVLYKPQGIYRPGTPLGRRKWRLARIKRLHPSSKDGRVRSVDLTLFDKATGVLYTLASQTIKNVAPLEILLTRAEKVANEKRNLLRRSARLQDKQTTVESSD